MPVQQDKVASTRQLAKYVRELWERHDVDHANYGSRLVLTINDGGDMLIIEEREGHRVVSIRYMSLTPDGRRFCELEILVYVDLEGHWFPYSIFRPTTGEKAYAEVDAGKERITVVDAINQQALAHYCDGWSFHLREQGWLEQGINPIDPGSKKRWPTPTVEAPDMETLEEWVWDSICEATDGCVVEPDAVCEHGHPSWLLRLGMI